MGKRGLKVLIFVGIGLAVSGFGMSYQNLTAEAFSDSSFSGKYDTINITDDVLIHYWIEGGEIITADHLGNSFKIMPNENGKITIAYPPIITKAYRDYYHDSYYDSIYQDIFVLADGQEMIHDGRTYHLKGHTVMEIPFGGHYSSVELFQAGLCNGFYFEDDETLSKP